MAPLKISKENANFIEAVANKSDEYYWFPFYFKKTGEQTFELVQFKDLPGELKHIVEQSENPNHEGDK